MGNTFPMTQTDIARYRLISQQLASATFDTATEMVAYMAAVQGQEYGPAKWGLGLRLPNLDEPVIEKDLSDGKILRTHLLRPTWHLVAATDIRWLLMLTGPRIMALNQSFYRKANLTAADFKKSYDIIGQMLEGGKQHTREEIKAELARRDFTTDNTRMICLMMQAELDGIICSGAKKDKQFTYALLEARAPKVPTKTRDEALAELALRYFTSRGPASIRDFSTWSGLNQTDCKKGLLMVESLFASETVDGETYYFSENIRDQKSPPKLYLLPIYDEMIIGYKNREAVLQSVFKSGEKIDVVFDNIIIFDGQVTGSWKRTIKPKHIEVAVRFLQPPTQKQQKALEQCLARYQSFHQLPLQIKML